MSPHRIERMQSPEMAHLMHQVEQLLEGHVLCMLVLRPGTNNPIMVCPPSHRKLMRELLPLIEWSNILDDSLRQEPT